MAGHPSTLNHRKKRVFPLAVDVVNLEKSSWASLCSGCLQIGDGDEMAPFVVVVVSYQFTDVVYLRLCGSGLRLGWPFGGCASASR